MAIRNSQDIVLVLTQPDPHLDIRNSQDVILLLGQNIVFTTDTFFSFPQTNQPVNRRRRNPIVESVSFCPVARGRFVQPQVAVIA